METISMSRKERKRLEAFSRVQAGALTLVAAGELLGLSYRQTKRSWSRYRSQGDAGLVHGLRGRASNRQSQDTLKQRSLELYRLQYADYGPTLAAECLAAEDDVVVSVTTLRRWLSQAGLWERRASGNRTVVVGRVVSAAIWCRWTVRIMIGSRGAAVGPC